MVAKPESVIGAKGAIQTMKKKQKTTAEVQAAIFRREHRKSPLRGGVKLTLKKARELALQEFKAIAADVLIRWEREKREGGEVGRVLPAEYVFFTGDGEVNHFRTEYEGGMFWDWSLKNPYSS
jgi:hypothetical protein